MGERDVSHGSEKRVRNHVLPIRLSDEEHAVIEDAAARSGLMIGSYARQVLLGAPAPRQVRRPPIERKELGRLLGELGKIGGNLNQIAKAMNTGVLVYEGEINTAVRSLVEMRDAVLAALGRAT
jgi:hypothetical protein